ncbi:MAG: CrcB family protein [Pseudomonadota bacterium]|nr:CrcB family protein [Pseudomonadota bacterium]
MKMLLFVAFGGAVGAAARYAVSLAFINIGCCQFPFSTFFVNTCGSVFLSVVLALLDYSWSASPEIRAFFVVGVLGGFTTFSAFSLDILILAERQRLDLLAAYLFGTLILSFAGLIAGLRLSRAIIT